MKVFEYLREMGELAEELGEDVATMKFVDEYRDGEPPRGSSPAPCRRITTRPWTLMEVCGGQTHAIVKFGIDELLPPRSRWSTGRAARCASRRSS